VGHTLGGLYAANTGQKPVLGENFRAGALRSQPAFQASKESVRLLADFEPPDDVEVTLRIDLFQVIQQASPPSDLHEQAPAAGIILLMLPQVLGQRVDPGRQNGDLDFRGARIHFGPPILSNQFLFPLFRNGHLLPRLLHLGWLRHAPQNEATIFPPCLLELFLLCLCYDLLKRSVYYLSIVLQRRPKAIGEKNRNTGQYYILWVGCVYIFREDLVL
jgi:hypothetical protein